jgi:hypothetical protein
MLSIFIPFALFFFNHTSNESLPRFPIPDCVDYMDDTKTTYDPDCGDYDDVTVYKVKCKNGDSWYIFYCPDDETWFRKDPFGMEARLYKDKDKSLKFLCDCED